MTIQVWHLVVIILLALIGWGIAAFRSHKRELSADAADSSSRAANTALLGATVAATSREVADLHNVMINTMVTKDGLKIAVLELTQEMQKLFNDKYYTRKDAEGQNERITKLESKP